MHQKQTGRVVFILCILLAALFGIFQQPQLLFRKDIPWSQKIMLRPGLDIAGGTSLLYQIKVPEGGYHSPDQHTLAEDVMAALKRRVDPLGEKNYIWRPQGEDRLEIQIPASPKNEEATKARDAYVDAQRGLDNFSIRRLDVINAIEKLSGAEQKTKLAELAAGVKARTDLFTKLLAKHAEIVAANTAQKANVEALAEIAYDKLLDQVDATNIKPGQLEAILEKPAPDRKAGLDALRATAAGSPDRLKAIDRYVTAFDAYRGLKSAIDDAAQLKRDLQGSGVLQFNIAAGPSADGTPDDLSNEEYDKLVAQLEKSGPRPHAGDKLEWFQLDRPDNYHGRQRAVKFDNKEYILCWTDDKREMKNGPGKQRWSMQDAKEVQEDGQNMVGFTLDTVGGKDFAVYTKDNLNRPLAAILDRKVVSVANIQSQIGASGTITGDYSEDELSYLIKTLNGGSMPAQLEDEPISEHTVGPALGKENLKRGLMACAFGLVIVGLFLICYYYVAGIVATFAVLMNVVLILGVLSMFGATFTLPGVAGIVLTIGAAVDANVLIFERLREEQHMGLSLRMAMRNAYDHAQSAIWDSNATTIITSLILMWLGSEEVKGFGTTLLIGLASSLFTSLFVTRTIFSILIDKFNVKHLGSFPLSVPKWDKFLKPNINWMGMAPGFWVLSTVIIGSGVIAFIATARNHELADVDFTSGTQVQFDLRKPMTLDQIRSRFETANSIALPAANITEVGSENGEKGTSYELVTANADAKAVKEAVLKVLGPDIKAELPSKFDHLADEVNIAKNDGVVVPITPGFVVNAFSDFKDWKPPGIDDDLNGCAIILQHIDPPLRPDQIRERLDRIRAALTSDVGKAALAQYTVVSPHGPGVTTDSAIVITADSDFPFDRDQPKWVDNVAEPLWKLVQEGVNSGGQLQKVNTFGPQVAGDNQQSAFFALILSSLVIMAYIWFRFGNLKYGTATVLAMIHDVALVVGAVGLSHYIVKIPWLANALMIEPFRVNLTIVAAVLTVMSYSMIDTIVVFDRIRENRGKFGYLNRQIVNDSINQTLSRTLLTAGTTIVTVAGMYVVGGPGIHGFTFVLLVGILVGTYSSIAIAAPFLLIGVEQPKNAGRKGPPASQLQRVGTA